MYGYIDMSDIKIGLIWSFELNSQYVLIVRISWGENFRMILDIEHRCLSQSMVKSPVGALDYCHRWNNLRFTSYFNLAINPRMYLKTSNKKCLIRAVQNSL